ncbi:hypothetical protein [Pseudovibrio sp. WM33]|uniref:hypothetical protein n=1 Tax=Pseudovibrio sp. WM33 TaxID=1735585 RepID=UPI0007AE385E|nr:hypothetical protein [Pseudovibrio sp. WM33]KZL23383.1 hypothetical protein PsWM33_03572 [Pseudovibrio sp. WM33]
MTNHIARYFNWIFLVSVLFPVIGEAQERDAICDALFDDLIKWQSEPPFNRDYRLYKVETFYSMKLDACISVEAKLFGAEVEVRDLTRTVIRDGIAKYPLLLHCDSDGVDEANISAVLKYRGNVYNVPYQKWLTDGQGGLPRALKTPDVPFNRFACEAALGRWLEQWGP